jgi:hypothetical protein
MNSLENENYDIKTNNNKIEDEWMFIHEINNEEYDCTIVNNNPLFKNEDKTIDIYNNDNNKYFEGILVSTWARL